MNEPPRLSALGPYVLNNHLLVESILHGLPEIRDIRALSQVSKRVREHVEYALTGVPKLSFAASPLIDDLRIQTVLIRNSLSSTDQPNQALRPKLAWRNLYELDLSGTAVPAATVECLIIACVYRKAAPEGTKSSSLPTWAQRLAAFKRCRRLCEQELGLKKLSVKNCPNVAAKSLAQFLAAMLTEASKAAGQAVDSNSAANAIITQALADQDDDHLGRRRERMKTLLLSYGINVSSPLFSLPKMTGDPDVLKRFLPCFSLEMLEVEGCQGLDVPDWTHWRSDIPSKRWSLLGGLTFYAGALGLDLDVKYCQGALCAKGLEDDDMWEATTSYTERHKAFAMRPFRTLPGQRIFISSSGRILRIPELCLTSSKRMPSPITSSVSSTLFSVLPGGIAVNLPGQSQSQTPHLVQLQPQPQPLHQQSQEDSTWAQAAGDYPHPQAGQPAPGMDVGPRGLSSGHGTLSDGARYVSQQTTRHVALPGEPRGVCVGCERELHVCGRCNSFWSLYCAPCAERDVLYSNAAGPE